MATTKKSAQGAKANKMNQVVNNAAEQTMTERQQAAQAKRDWLRTISADFQAQRELMEMTGAEYIPTINEMLHEHYAKQSNITELNTFDQWKEKGYQVRKGEKAYLFWGKPKAKKQATTEEQSEQAEQTEKKDFYPICYLFDISQCRKINA